MIGRGAIRNQRLFEQIRQRHQRTDPFLPTGREVLAYIGELWNYQCTADVSESGHVQRMKKFMNFVGEGIPPADQFLHQIRRVETRSDFFRVCEAYLNHDEPMTLEPREAVAPSNAERLLCVTEGSK